MAQDTNPNPAPVATPAEASKRLAEHGYVAVDGSATDKIESAIGITYLDKASKEAFEYRIPDGVAGSVQTMFSIFGAKTRCTNAASAARQKRERDATYVQSDVDYIKEVFGETSTGVWSPEGEGVRAPTYDLEVLADVVTELATRDSGKQQDRGKILAKLTTDVKWRRGAIGNSAVKLEYLSRMAAKTPAAKGAAGLALD